MKKTLPQTGTKDLAGMKSYIKELDSPALLTDKELRVLLTNGSARRLGFRIGDLLHPCIGQAEAELIASNTTEDAVTISFDGKGISSAEVSGITGGFCFVLKEQGIARQRCNGTLPASRPEMLDFISRLDGGKNEERLALKQLSAVRAFDVEAASLAHEEDTTVPEHFDPVHAVSAVLDALKGSVVSKGTRLFQHLASPMRFCRGSKDAYGRLVADMLAFAVACQEGECLVVTAKAKEEHYILEAVFSVGRAKHKALCGLGVSGGLFKEQLDRFVDTAYHNGWRFFSERLGDNERFVLELPFLPNTRYLLKKPEDMNRFCRRAEQSFSYYAALSEGVIKTK
ncbi:MAG: hypothetical protein IKK83_00090 [Clostridia bacterium]|nr:hypothetical protein [Clostridia bacterium]